MQSFFYSFCCGLFARVDSTGGASVGASAAINAFIGIDFVDIAFRDSVGGTFAHASAASNTIIANNVSHSFEFKKLILIVSVSGKSTAFLFLDKLNWIFFDGECFFDKSFSSLTGNISMFFAFYSYFRKTIEKDIIHMGMFCCRRFGIGAATKVAALAVRRPAAFRSLSKDEAPTITTNVPGSTPYFIFLSKYANLSGVTVKKTVRFSPGFNVGLVGDLYICPYLNLRFTPTLLFGNKTVELREDHSDTRRTVDLKSTYIMMPVSIKYSAKRLNNYCPYLSLGVAPTIDISKKRNDLLRLNTYDTYLEVGVGCDIYLPFFKLIPELKFCFGLSDVVKHKRNDLVDPLDIKYTQAVSKAFSRLVVLSIYFE